MAALREMYLTGWEKALGGLVLSVWLVFAGMLLDGETLLFSGGGTTATRSILKEVERFHFRRMGIYDQARRVGFTETRLEREDNGTFRLNTLTEATLNLVGRVNIPILMSSEMVYSARGEPETLTMAFSVPMYKTLSFDARGVRVDRTMRVTVRQVGKVLMEHTVPLPEESTFDTGLIPLGDMPNLTVGREWPVNGVNIISQSPERGTARVTALERIDWNGAPVDAYRVEVTMHGNTFMKPVAHILPDGRLVQLTGFAQYRFVREEPDDQHRDAP